VSTAVVTPAVTSLADPDAGLRTGWRALLAAKRIDRVSLALGLATAPVSIAVAETFLTVALVVRLVGILRSRARPRPPRIFWFWLVWAGLETSFWLFSLDRKAGWSEIRHLLLSAAMFFILPALDRATDWLTVWKGIFLTSTLSALFLIGDFATRLIHYRRELAVAFDPSLYLRSGGLLNHWMIFGAVEIMIVAGLISFWQFFPESRRRWWPLVGIHGVAIVFSLTRMTWVACFVLLAVHLAWRRSRWFWALPALPLVLYLLVPSVVKTRVHESLKPGHYSNLERL